MKVLSIEELEKEMEKHSGKRLSAVKMVFQGSTSGAAELIFPSVSANKLITAFTGEESEDMDPDSIRVGTLGEIGNIVLNAVLGSISNILKFNLKYTVPSYIEGTPESLLPSEVDPDSVILLAETRFTIAELKVEGDIALFFELEGFDMLLEVIDNFEVDGGARKRCTAN